MSTTTTTATPATDASTESFTKLELVSAQGPVYRQVSSRPPRDARSDEVPIIDLTALSGDLAARTELAQQVGAACRNYGFFYIKKHGIPEHRINKAREEAIGFFQQPAHLKEQVAENKSKFNNGWSASRTRKVSPTESADGKEGFIWSYDPSHDPDVKDPSKIPDETLSSLHCEDFIWEGTEHLPEFRSGLISYWRECVALSRKLVRIFALALDLPENHFDRLVSYPGSDGAINYYPAAKQTGKIEGSATSAPQDVGIGSHTDLQCFTLLWQDQVGGLQVLSRAGQWLRVPPIEDTLVVNIGDYLMRLTNDQFISNVHRVVSHAPVDRLSMPFFFGFNFDETVAVLPSCVDEEHPAKYEPISCGNWCKKRLTMVRLARK